MQLHCCTLIPAGDGLALCQNYSVEEQHGDQQPLVINWADAALCCRRRRNAASSQGKGTFFRIGFIVRVRLHIQGDLTPVSSGSQRTNRQ